MKRWLALALWCIALLVMTGCSSVRLVDSDVTAFSSWKTAPPVPGTTYRFERLPSQQALGQQQDFVEGLSGKALAKVGLVLNPPAARLSVQVVINTQVVERYPYDYGYGGLGTPGVFVGGGSRGVGFGLSFPLRFPEAPWYKRELTILMRDLATGQVMYETRALHDGVWSDTLAVLPAMLDAALTGFPQPPPGTRRIDIEIPR